MDRIPSPRILTLDPNDENIILEIPEDVDPSAPVTPAAKKEKVIFFNGTILAKPTPGSEKFNIFPKLQIILSIN